MKFAKYKTAAFVFTLLYMALPASAVSAEQGRPAKELFGFTATPAPLAARAIGSYARGCLAGGTSLAVDGPYWQVMRLSRNRNWGHPVLVGFLEKFAKDAGEAGDWSGLLVGDLAQPRGGPMLSGHSSHQIGLDADIWLNEMPDRRLSQEEREKRSAISVVNFKTNEVDRTVWSPRHARLIRRAASYSEVARIFVNPVIKKELCQTAGSEREWLAKVRPWAGHHYHMHVRLSCPPGSTGCKDQAPPDDGDGCGADLARWFAPPPPGLAPRKPAPPLTLANLPNYCKTVLQAGVRPLSAAAPPAPKASPHNPHSAR